MIVVDYRDILDLSVLCQIHEVYNWNIYAVFDSYRDIIVMVIVLLLLSRVVT